MRFFVSYSRSVKPELKPIVDLLRAAGHDVWWDAEIPEIADWWATILDNIERCEVLIFVVSEKSVLSPYCLAELRYATDRNRPILPFVIDDHTSYTIPPEVSPQRNQWFLYDGDPARTLKRITEATNNIQWGRYGDVPIARPIEPNKGEGSLAREFQQAVSLAENGHFDEAIKRFRNVSSLDYHEWGDECQQWVVRLQLYKQIAELAEHKSTQARAHKKWNEYLQLFDVNFDPLDISEKLAPFAQTQVKMPSSSRRNFVRPPLLDDYRAAVANPKICFRDPELQNSKIATNKMGLPMCWSGQFASVYRAQTASGDYAIRCFTWRIVDQQERYEKLAAYIKGKSFVALAEFDYQPTGILVSGTWYPIVKMNWMNGIPLDKFIDGLIGAGKTDQLNQISDLFWQTIETLQENGIAHGDLQHGNILIERNSVRLIDYDAMFVPSLRERDSLEKGHPNYQHPNRKISDFGPNLDTFSALSIYLSLKALVSNPKLWAEYHHDSGLIFNKADYENPHQSTLISLLKNSRDTLVSDLARQLETSCLEPISQVQKLRDLV